MSGGLAAIYAQRLYWRVFFRIMTALSCLISVLHVMRSIVENEGDFVLVIFLMKLGYGVSECLCAVACLAAFFFVAAAHRDRELHLYSLLGLSLPALFRMLIPAATVLFLYMVLYAGYLKPEMKRRLETAGFASACAGRQETGRNFFRPIELPGMLLWADGMENESFLKPELIMGEEGGRILVRAQRADLCKGGIMLRDGEIASAAGRKVSLLRFSTLEAGIPQREVKANETPLWRLGFVSWGTAELHRRLHSAASAPVLLVFGLAAGCLGALRSLPAGLILCFAGMFCVHFPLVLAARSIKDCGGQEIVRIWLPAILVLLITALLARLLRGSFLK